MRAISTIFRRELAGYLRSPIGYIIIGFLLFIDGILFQAMVLGAGKKQLSGDVLQRFFEFSSYAVAAAGILLSFRVLAEERQQKTLVLLTTSPIRNRDIILGKYFASLVFLGLMLVCSVYMPLLIMVNGKISLGQVLVGYLGLFLLGGATLAIGIFASSLTSSILIALSASTVIAVFLGNLMPLAKKLHGDVAQFFQELDLWYAHFQGGFMRGIFNLKDFVYYIAIIYFFLLLASKTLEMKRWQ